MNPQSPVSRAQQIPQPTQAQSEQSTRTLSDRIYDLANKVFQAIAWTCLTLSQGCNQLLQSLFGNNPSATQTVSCQGVTNAVQAGVSLPSQQGFLDDQPSTRAVNPMQLAQASRQARIPIRKTIHSYPGPLNQSQKPAAHLKQKNRLEITWAIDHQLGLSIRKEDLFGSRAQAIVNAANTYLGGGGGIDGAIHRQGGLSYAQEHGRLKEAFGGRYLGKDANYIEGYAALIGSGDLLKKFQIEQVMVVAAPNCQNENPRTLPQNVKNALYSCYLNSLLVAEEQGLTSIAFPSLGTGIFQFPVYDAADIALRAIHDFLEIRDRCKNIKTISIHFLPTEPESVTFDPYRSACQMAR